MAGSLTSDDAALRRDREPGVILASGRCLPRLRQPVYGDRMARRQDALDYHRRHRHGKLEVVPTKPLVTQLDLSLAYTPGVAEPCLEIAADPEKSWEYTARGNLVAVISNGTAVPRPGRHRPGRGQAGDGRQSLPVQEVRRHRRLRPGDRRDRCRPPGRYRGRARADLRRHQPRGHSRLPGCFEVERKLRERMRIPVFHDDQHGTAIISGAALLNAAEVVGKQLGGHQDRGLGRGRRGHRLHRVLHPPGRDA